MNLRDEKWGVIINPAAGTRNLRKDWIKIYRLLKRAEINFTYQATEYAGHAVGLARNYVENGFLYILVIGGDGTLNEVVNGIMTSKIEDKSSVSLALMPYGTGNDWARYWGLHKPGRNISERLYNRRRQLIDIGLLEYQKNGKPMRQYFINGAGFGFDGRVLQMTNCLKYRLGGRSWVYTLSVVCSVFAYKSADMNLKSDDESYSGDIFTISVGNGCYTGGGLKQTPGADPTDGIFHITAIQSPSFFKILFGLKDLFAGRLDKHPLAKTFVTKTFSIKTQPHILVETDGVLIDGDGEYKISNIHHAINMII